MGGEIEIRDVASGDLAQWRSVWAGYNAFYGRTGPTALPEEIVLSTWRRLLDDAEPVHGLVAERRGGRAGELVGLAHYIFHRNMLTIADTCYLQDLFAVPSARGEGVGRRLIEAVYDRARRAGASGVYWHTHESNQTAMRLYDKVAVQTGFVVYRKAF